MNISSNKTLPSAVLLSCLAISPSLHANEIRGIAGMSVDFGGETLVTVTMTDNSEKTIKSHEGVGFMGGVYAPLNNGYGVTAQIGYKMATVTASNGSLEFTRIPIEIIGSKQVGKHRFGGGFTYHTNGKFTCDVSGLCNDEIDIDDASGFLLSYEFILNNPNSPSNDKGMIFGARYTMMEYKDPDGTGIDASGFGMYLGGQF